MAFLIDSLGSGGAQRQLVELAIGMKERGHDVSFARYHPLDFYSPILREAGIEPIELRPRNSWEKVRFVRSWLKEFKPDVLQSFLQGPNGVGALAGLGGRSWKFVASERFLRDPQAPKRFPDTADLYRFADWVVSNSHTNQGRLLTDYPWLRRKVSVIPNMVDLNRFRPAENPRRNDVFRFTVVATMRRLKNAPRVVEALAILRTRTDRPFRLDWFGRIERDHPDHRAVWAETEEAISRYKLQDVFVLKEPTLDIPEVLRESDALLLASLTEGFPNVVAEAMASGLPVIASAVSDIPLIVEEGVNGFLFDPADPKGIAAAMERCLNLPEDEFLAAGRLNRLKAERNFSRERFLDQYELLYRSLTGRP